LIRNEEPIVFFDKNCNLTEVGGHLPLTSPPKKIIQVVLGGKNLGGKLIQKAFGRNGVL
jgi:hypothetical protein